MEGTNENNIYFFMLKNENKKVCQKWDSNPRPQRGPEQLELTQ